MAERIGLEAVLEDKDFQDGLKDYLAGIDKMNKKTSSVTNRLSTSFTSVGGKILKVAGILSTAVVAGASAAAIAVGKFTVDGIVAAKDMEEQISGIAAILNKSKDEVQPLSDLITDLGLDPRLKVTATEAAEAIELLARNGLDMTEIMDGAAFSTVLLANSTGTTFGNAANIATDAMAIFNIKASDMGTAVDGITSVTTNSKFSIDDFALALANGGSVAASSGVSFDDFNTVIAAISPQFSSGMTAGTGFKNLLLRLAPTTDKAKDAMSELGIITADGVNSFFDAEGSLKDMDQVAQILQDSLIGLSEEQRNVALRTIFGNDAMGAAIGLMSLGAAEGQTAAEAFGELQQQMGETDAAESAATRMDNLSGALEILGGIIDTVKLQVGNVFISALTNLARKLSEIATGVGPKVVEFFQFTSDLVSDFINEVTNGEGPLAGLMNALRSLGVPEDNRVQILGFVAAVRDLIDTVVTFVTEHKDSFIAAIKGIGTVLAGAAIAATVAAIVTAITALINPVSVIAALVGLLSAAWAENWGDIRGVTAKVTKFISNKLSGIETAIKPVAKFLEPIGEAFGNLFDSLEKGFSGGGLKGLIAAIPTSLNSLWAQIKTWFESQDWVSLAMNAAKAIIAGFGTLAENTSVWLGGLASAIIEWINSQDWNEIGMRVMTLIGNAFVAAVSFAVLEFAVIFEVIRSWFAAQNWGEIALNAFVAIRNAWIGLASGIGAALASWFLAFVAWVQDQDWVAIATDVITFIIDGLEQFSLMVGDTLNGWWETISLWFSEVDWLGLATGILLKITEGLGQFWAFVSETFAGWFTSIQTWFDGIDWTALALGLITDLIAGFVQFWVLAGATIGGWWTAIKEWFDSIDWEQLGSDVVKAIGTGLETFFENVVDTLEGWFTSIRSWFEEKDWQQIGSDVTISIGEGLETFFENVVDTLEGWFQSIRNWLATVDLIGIGQSIIEGIVVGVVNSTGALVGAIRDGIQQGITGAQDDLDSRSPSKVFEEIGETIPQGLAAGVRAASGMFVAAIGSVANDAVGAISDLFSGVDNTTEQFIENTHVMADAFSSLTNTLIEKAASVEGLFDLGSVFGSLGRSAAGIFGRDVLDPLENEIDRLEGELESRQGIIAAALGVDDFADLGNEQIINAFFGAIQGGNDKLRRNIEALWNAQRDLNTTTGEYEDQQARILALQEAQQNLRFLEQQNKLIELIQENQLNAADILGGLQLGIGADAGAVVDAMTRAIQAIINQAEVTLGISSPSKVFERIGKFITTGLIRGISTGASQVGTEINRLLSPDIQSAGLPLALQSMPQSPVIIDSGGTTNNQFNLAMNTRESSLGVRRSFGLMERLRG